MRTDIKDLDTLYKASDGSFNEFIPVDDSTVDTYFESLDRAEDLPPGPGQNKGAKATAKPKKRRQRSAHQQLLNKLAQLRYRERKRQKLEKLENRVNALSGQIDDLQTLDAETKALENQNAALEQQLQKKEAEVESAKQAQSPTKSTFVDSEGSSRPQKDPAAKKAELDNLVQRWLATVEEIRQLYGMLMMDSTGSNNGAVLKNCRDFSWMPASQQRMMLNVVARVDMLVETVINLCVQVLRLDGLSIEAIMNANFDRCQTLVGWKDEQKWIRAAQELNFTPQQKTRILQARREMLQKLQRIYAERQELNLASVKMLLGPNTTPMGQAPTLSEDERQNLMQVLSGLEENLKAEQRAVSEQEYITFKHLLTPLQSGLFIIRAFPDHCDCLALVNAVHVLYGG